MQSAQGHSPSPVQATPLLQSQAPVMCAVTCSPHVAGAQSVMQPCRCHAGSNNCRYTIASSVLIALQHWTVLATVLHPFMLSGRTIMCYAVDTSTLQLHITLQLVSHKPLQSIAQGVVQHNMACFTQRQAPALLLASPGLCAGPGRPALWSPLLMRVPAGPCCCPASQFGAAA